MKKIPARPIVKDPDNPHSRSLYKKKEPLLTPRQKFLFTLSFFLLVLVVLLTLWVLEQRQQALKKARDAHFDYARVLKEKARQYAEKEEWPLAKLFTVNSMLYQAQAGQFLTMTDIPFPLETRGSALDFLTFIHRTGYSVAEITRLLKDLERQTGLVIDGTTPVAVWKYHSLDLDYYKKKSQYNTAEDAFNAAVDFYLRGTQALQQHEYPAAIAQLNQALNLRPRYKEALNKLGWAYFLNGDTGKAKTVYKKAKKIDPAYYSEWNSQQWAERGNRQKKSGDFYRARHSYQEALRINPLYYHAHDRLGETYEDLHQYDNAIAGYKKAGAALPLFTREWESKISYNRALKYMAQRQYDEAIAEFKEAIRLYPQLERAWLKLSTAYQYQKDKKVVFRGKPWDFIFNETELKDVLIFMARQLGVNLVIAAEVTGKITCELEQVEWDKALELFVRINGCDSFKMENVFIIGKPGMIKTNFKGRPHSDKKDVRIKKYTGKSMDLSLTGVDIQFALQTLAAKANLKMIIDPGINNEISCEFRQIPWDMALDVLLEMHGLAKFQFSNLLRIGRKTVLEPLVRSEEGMMAIIPALLSLDPSQVNFKNERGKTLLFLAAEKGYPQLTQYLMANGARVNDADNWHFTPLHDAMNKETAEVLVNRGAFLEVRSNTGLTPLQTAVYALRLEVARYLAEKGAVSDIFMDAAMGRFEKVQQYILKNPKMVNSTGIGGWTPLHHAVTAGQYLLVEFLLAHKATLNTATLKGDTPLHLAVARGRTRIVKLLVVNGAEMNTRNKYGDTPLTLAKATDNKDIIKLLEKYGAHD